MITITKTMVVLKYPAPGEPGWRKEGYDINEAEKFVDLDSYSGGYPYPTTIDRAHDFKTTEAARKYKGHFNEFTVHEVQVTYLINEVK